MIVSRIPSLESGSPGVVESHHKRNVPEVARRVRRTEYCCTVSSDPIWARHFGLVVLSQVRLCPAVRYPSPLQ